jgi:Galactose oxidase, central domain/Kelch motif
MKNRRLATLIAVAALLGGACGAAATPTPTATPTAAPTPTAASTAAPPSATPAPTAAPTATPQVGLKGPLGDGRQVHTATVLADGRVLVAGGTDYADQPLASVTLYDPTAGTFSQTGSMGTARAFFTATLLPDGRVLVAGGGPPQYGHPGPDLATAELYDPKSGTFTPTGSMTTTREDHSATLLRDGRVLIAGGNDKADHAVASAELYDPKTGKFSATGSMAIARGYHTAALLADGRVLIVGGAAAAWTSMDGLASAELYDPKTGTFTATGSMASALGFPPTATLLEDGRVLVTGTTATGTLSELYDPKTGTFTPTGSMTTPRPYTTATLLADGRVLVAGGGSDYANRNFLASAEIFDPTTGAFSATGSMSAARTWCQASLLADGRVLITGGYGSVAPLASAELYDPKTGTFSPAGGG